MKVIAILILTGIIWYSCSSQKNDSSRQNIKLYFVAAELNSTKGKAFGCNDALIEITKNIKVEKSPLESALNELVAAKDTDELKNYVKGFQLMVFQVTIASGVADVYLNGELSISGACDIPRIREQLNETAKQFSDLKKVNFYINTQPLEKYLDISGQGF